MKKTVVIHQPDFLSYLGFFHRLLHADLYVVLDNVQYVTGTSQSWMNRDKIKTQSGEKWLTISVNKAPRDTNINDIKINDAVDWQNQNLEFIKQNYRKSPFFDEIFPHLKKLYMLRYEKLADFNMASIMMLLKLFDIIIEIEYASNFITTKTKSERLVEILTQVKATHYLSGIGARDYHVDEPFHKAGIDVVWQEFKHPVYPQLYEEFIPFLSSIDLLFNCGIEKSRDILRSC